MKWITTHEGTVLEQLKRAFPDSSMSTLRSWIEQRRVFVGEQRSARGSFHVGRGTSMTLIPKPLPHEGPLKIVYEDDDLIVVDKPPGLLSVASETGREPSAHAWIKHRYPGRVIPVVHRLDRETSGLMIFALNSISFQRLKAMLARREITRLYHALIEGTLLGEGRWENYLLETADLSMRVCSRPSEGTVKAITHYKVLKAGPVYSLIECSLETGKKNQIRVQAAHAGHPVAGDTKYGCIRADATRLCLHSCRLECDHPTTHKHMVFESPTPRFFTSAPDRFREHRTASP